MGGFDGWVEKGRALFGRKAPAPDPIVQVPPVTVKFVIIGNCQAGAIQHLLPLLSSRIEVLGAVPIDATPDNVHDKYAAMLAQADHIVVQRIRDDYPVEWVRQSNLAQLYGDKLIVYANHFFDGYFPELCYIHDPKGQRHILPGPMESYHYKTVIHAYQQGMDVAGAIALCDDDAFSAGHFSQAAALSLAELKRREVGIDIPVADFIETHYRDRQLFFTFNHPTTWLLLYSCDRILRHIGVTPERHYSEPNPGEYLQLVSKPVEAPLYRSLGLTFQNQTLHKGVELEFDGEAYRCGSAAKYYEIGELVETFYRLYDANRKRIRKFPLKFGGLPG